MAITNGFQVSPGVNVKEKDITQYIAAVSSTDGGLAGVYSWGPMKQITLVNNQGEYVKRFGKPSNANFETWFVGANFLDDSDNLHVSRAGNTAGTSPYVTVTVTAANSTVVTTNTAPLAEGMILVSSDNGTIRAAATIASIVNSTAFTLASSSQALVSNTDTLQFKSNNAVFSAFGNTGPVANLSSVMVFNKEDFAAKEGTFDTDVKYIARYPGADGNSIRVSQCDTATAFNSTINLAAFGATVSINAGSNVATITLANTTPGANLAAATASINALAQSLKGNFQLTDQVEFGDNDGGYQSLQVAGFSNVVTSSNSTLATATFTMSFVDQLKLISDKEVTTSLTRYWEFYDLIDTAPGQSTYVRNSGNTAANDELHVVVVDDGGVFTGVPGSVLEVYKNVSRATDSKTEDGNGNYYREVINQASQYVWAVNDRSTAVSNTALNVTSATNNQVLELYFDNGSNGADESSVSLGDLAAAYDKFASGEDVDISLIMTGKARGGPSQAQLGNYLVDNIAEKRKDCVVFISPPKNTVVNNIGNEVDAIVEFRNANRSSSYAFMDSGYMYMYDRYNDVYRWVPLNGSIAGLAVRTDRTNDPWWSFAGFNRGQLKNVVKLAWNPKKAERDQLYKSNVNPVNTFPGDGTVLYGDKTLQAKASAFDRINVRRLFIVLEKAISNYAKYSLFEFNDDITRSLFKSRIIPYLRDVKSRRGLYEFLVVCDKTNNTGEVIDRNEFVGDIKVKPARSINFITLNFVAVGTSVSFSEIASI